MGRSFHRVSTYSSLVPLRSVHGRLSLPGVKSDLSMPLLYVTFVICMSSSMDPRKRGKPFMLWF
ncbi:hypothetical protein HanRHA438_Chr10g0458451 [Helianthus annuus]|uniref:Uncharacterized protein n=1 Tax=Helianthus annuus TaxID=4232 RepID=A0A9K3N4B8_HELAN|nr:hypothetical protein HanXRQr2_Chr10g0446021 [Helianthus annuus]KAJ0880040.1 hypothetical protein HanRHA438_Chr10g0458451 [Helianthus annuus]